MTSTTTPPPHCLHLRCQTRFVKKKNTQNHKKIVSQKKKKNPTPSTTDCTTDVPTGGSRPVEPLSQGWTCFYEVSEDPPHPPPYSGHGFALGLPAGLLARGPWGHGGHSGKPRRRSSAPACGSRAGAQAGAHVPLRLPLPSPSAQQGSGCGDGSERCLKPSGQRSTLPSEDRLPVLASRSPSPACLWGTGSRGTGVGEPLRL